MQKHWQETLFADFAEFINKKLETQNKLAMPNVL
jgi:hypothetical protein